MKIISGRFEVESSGYMVYTDGYGEVYHIRPTMRVPEGFKRVSFRKLKRALKYQSRITVRLYDQWHNELEFCDLKR